MQNSNFFESIDKVFIKVDDHLYSRFIFGGQWSEVVVVDTATRQYVQHVPVNHGVQILLDFAYGNNSDALLFASPLNTQSINDIPTTHNAVLSLQPPVLDTQIIPAVNTGPFTPPHDNYQGAAATSRRLVLPPSSTTITPPLSDDTHSIPSSSSSSGTQSLANEPESSGPAPYGYNKACFCCARRKVGCVFEAGRSRCKSCIKSNSACTLVPKQKPGRKRKGE